MRGDSQAANGQPVWACYWAGLPPSDAETAFTVRLAFVDGESVVTWAPGLLRHWSACKYRLCPGMFFFLQNGRGGVN